MRLICETFIPKPVFICNIHSTNEALTKVTHTDAVIVIYTIYYLRILNFIRVSHFFHNLRSLINSITINDNPLINFHKNISDTIYDKIPVSYYLHVWTLSLMIRFLWTYGYQLSIKRWLTLMKFRIPSFVPSYKIATKVRRYEGIIRR